MKGPLRVLLMVSFNGGLTPLENKSLVTLAADLFQGASLKSINGVATEGLLRNLGALKLLATSKYQKLATLMACFNKSSNPQS